MRSFTQKMNRLATTTVRGASNPRSSTGGVPRKSWAYRSKHDVPSVVFTIPVDHYLATR